MEEIDELAFLFDVKACAYDSMPLWVLQVQRNLLCLLGWLERTLSFTFFGVRGQGRLLASQGHNSIQHLLLFGDHEGLGQPTVGCCTLRGLLIVFGYGDNALGTRHLHLEVGVVGHSHELGQGGRPSSAW